MGVTTRMALPYPAGTDEPNVPVDMKELADRLAAVAAGWLPPGTLATRPAPASALDRHLYYAYDTVEIFMCVDPANDGSFVWSKISTDQELAVKLNTDRTINPVPLRITRSGKDANGIFTVVEEYRVGGNRATRSVLSGGASPRYATRTVTEYDTDGATVLRTTAYTLTYDADDDLTSETSA